MHRSPIVSLSPFPSLFYVKMDLGVFVIEVNSSEDLATTIDKRVNAFMDRVKINDEDHRKRLLPLLKAQASLLRVGIRHEFRIHTAEGKFVTEEFKAKVVVIVHF